MVVSSMAGFALAVLRFPYRRFLFVVILSSLMIPVQVVLVPLHAHDARPRSRQHAYRADPVLHRILPAVLGLHDDGVLLGAAARADRGGADRRGQAAAGLVARDGAAGNAGAGDAGHHQYAQLLERHPDRAADHAEEPHPDGRHIRAQGPVFRPDTRCLRQASSSRPRRSSSSTSSSSGASSRGSPWAQ